MNCMGVIYHVPPLVCIPFVIVGVIHHFPPVQPRVKNTACFRIIYLELTYKSTIIFVLKTKSYGT